MRAAWTTRAAVLLILGAILHLGCRGGGETRTETSLERGLSAYEAGAYESAIYALKIAARDSQDPRTAYKYLAKIYRRRVDYAGGAHYFEGREKKRPDDPGAAYYHGYFAYEMGQTGRARAALGRALDLEPEHRKARYYYAFLCLGTGDYEEGIETVQAAPEDSPTDSRLENIHGLLLHRAGRFEEAEVAFRRGLLLEPDSAPLLANLGKTLIAKREVEEAEENFERALELDPTNLAALYGLTTLLYRQGRDAEAEPYSKRFRARQSYVDALLFEQSNLSENPRDASALMRMGRFAEIHEDFPRALDCYRRVLLWEPDHEEARGALEALAGRRAEMADPTPDPGPDR